MFRVGMSGKSVDHPLSSVESHHKTVRAHSLITGGTSELKVLYVPYGNDNVSKLFLSVYL